MLNRFDFDNLRNLTIGTVDFVSPNEMKILLEVDAPQNTALNTGVPSLFPKINGYVLIPNEIGAVVGIINYLGVEHSQYPKRKGLKDYDLIDLPFPLRKMSINPIGTLKQKGRVEEKEYELERGVYTFPSIGDSVILPTENQLRAIVENKDENAVVVIGKAALAANADVKINPDKLFGRHLAVLGNTGSGKSCSVAGLIRWSLESAKEKAGKNGKPLNARFIVLDPNGEYTTAFDGIDKPVRKYKIKMRYEIEDSSKDLKIPAWLWNSHEWISFSQAAPGAQRPILLDALMGLKSGREVHSYILVRLNRLLLGYLRRFEMWISKPAVNMAFKDLMDCGRTLMNLHSELGVYLNNIQNSNTELKIGDAAKTELETALGVLAQAAYQLQARKAYAWKEKTAYNEFLEAELENITSSINNVLKRLPSSVRKVAGVSADTPLPFDVTDLPKFIDQVSDSDSNNFSQFVAMLNLRLRFLFEDERLKSVVNPQESLSLEEWLNEYIGANNSDEGQIAVIDLSLIPSDVIHIIVAVFSRLVFEAIQRYRRRHQKELPTVIVLEEAHTFIRDGRNDEVKYSHLCQDIFERIAREGRKFGLSLVLSSQRPSELSPTVLSQCNTFLLHRIVNDRDQELVKKLVPDNIGSLLKELPILPTQKAILLGWAAAIPILVELRDLKREHCPQSNDPSFWDVWVGNKGGEREINWKIIADEWQHKEHADGFEKEEVIQELFTDNEEIF